MTQAGIPTGHEALLGLPFGGTYVEGMTSEVSWLAAPMLGREKAKGAKIIHIVRNPLKQISSAAHSRILEDHCFRSNVYTMYKEVVIPELRRYRLLDRYMLYYLKWNELISKHADLTYRLEDLIKNPQELFDDLGVDVSKVKFDLTKKNAYKKVKQLTLEDLEGYLWTGALKEFMKAFSYL
jgi:hypothetical protein